MIPWWVNFTAGAICMMLAVNFFAASYGLRLGDRALNLGDFPKAEPRKPGEMPRTMPF